MRKNNILPDYTEKQSVTGKTSIGLFLIIAALMLTATALRFATNAGAQKNLLAGNISGRVFQDFNGNGIYNTTTSIANSGSGTIGVAIDRGVLNVQVRAYNAAGVNVTTGGVVTTAADGTYTLTTNDAGAGPYRVEFTSLPSGFQPSARSTDSVNGGISTTESGSTVQFVSTPASNVNLAVNYPADYSQNNPEVVASQYEFGDQITGTNNSATALVSFPYAAGSTDTAAGANETLFDAPAANPLDVAANQIGTTYGLAYARRSRLIYVGAYFKRHAGFGPQGANAIYVVNRVGSGGVNTFFTVPGTATNLHDTTNYSRDNNNIGWDGVGKSSLGGIAVSEDESSLFVYNLENRTLYKLNSANGAQIASQATMPTLPAPLPTVPLNNCAAGDARPFALTVYRNTLYVGIICSAESSTTVDTFTDSNGNNQYDPGDYFVDANLNNVRDAGESYIELTGNAAFDAGEAFVDNDGNRVYNLGDARQLRAYVYSVDQTTLAYGAAPVFQTTLNYRRGLATRTSGARGEWRPWSNIYRNISTGANRPVYAQPMLTDIAFDNGNLVLGLRDRISDQVGNGTLSNPSDPSNTTFYQPRTSGDVLRACGAVGSWTLEANGRCGGTGAAPQNVSEGPGGGEFYFGDAYDLAGDFVSPAVTITGKGGNHDDTASGGVEQLPGAPDVMISNFDPLPNIANMTHDGGIRWLSNTTGNFTKGYRLYNGNGNDTGIFGKAGGIGGNLTILSDPAPIEIGNRIWRDTNSNGVQDPGEAGIGNVTVRLYQGSTLVGTAVTDANGEYYFVSSTTADANTADNLGQVNGGILPNTSYQLRLDNPANYTIGNALFGLFLTTSNQTSQLGDDDASDSDAVSALNPPGSPSAGNFGVVNVTTGTAGNNNHTYDFGFVTAPTPAGAVLNGMVYAGGRGLSGVTVTLSGGRFQQPLTARTNSFGYYSFADLPVGETYVVSVVSTKKYHFQNPNQIVNLQDNATDVNFEADSEDRLTPRTLLRK